MKLLPFHSLIPPGALEAHATPAGLLVIETDADYTHPQLPPFLVERFTARFAPVDVVDVVEPVEVAEESVMAQVAEPIYAVPEPAPALSPPVDEVVRVEAPAPVARPEPQPEPEPEPEAAVAPTATEPFFLAEAFPAPVDDTIAAPAPSKWQSTKTALRKLWPWGAKP